MDNQLKNLYPWIFAGGDLLVKVLEDYDDYEGRALPQNNVGVSYAPAVNKSYAFLDFNKQESIIIQLYRIHKNTRSKNILLISL